MTRLVVCCDGTWQTAEQKSPSNVARLSKAVKRNGDQLVFYRAGVGAAGGVMDRLTGGGLGVGVDREIKCAYLWLATHHQTDDKIFLFGFSRGAYTVRSLAGMLKACGLAHFAPELSTAQRRAVVDRLYDDVYRPRSGRPAGQIVPHRQVDIQFLGVWDTVGALGIPDTLGVLNLFDVGDRHRFYDTTLSDRVIHARHAVALDESRGPFVPTLWTSPVPTSESGRTVKQVWFPGDHCDVGGGHREIGLSDGALEWMVKEAADAGLVFDTQLVNQLRPNPADKLHDASIGFYRLLSPRPRAIPPVDATLSEGVLNQSVFARQAAAPNAVSRYRPTRVMAPGESGDVVVHARQLWNDTGIYLEKGRYTFEATGEWSDMALRTGPGGTNDRPFQLSAVAHVAGSFAGWLRTGLRRLGRNKDAEVYGAPRDDAAWMALIGVVAAEDFDEDGVQKSYDPFVIGEQYTHEVKLPGYLYAYANDATIAYWNNRGSVSLKITRIS